MRDVIQKIIASEAEAKQLVASARAESERIVSEARKRAEALRARVNRETQAEAERILAGATRNGEREKAGRVALAAAEIKTQVRLEPFLREQAAAEVVRCVCGQTHPAEESP
jgi:vacuolar-type H+-ATPase subunit H